ncbi:WD40 repeat domain-containing protein [Luedemannella helvata]|uniref:Phytase-like domain-containing protein n=1 Tax=Luedemannella helvata TaxID=349315 RepID=A0ABN2K8L3_9ACTN
MKPRSLVVSGVMVAVLGAGAGCSSEPLDVGPEPTASAAPSPASTKRPGPMKTFDASGTHPGFPSGRITIQEDAPDLPADRAVGRAALVVRDLESRTHLVMRDGTQWNVPLPADTSGVVVLSPDGRVLGYPTGDGFVLRDLMSRTSSVVPGFAEVASARAWSPNGRWLIGQARDDGKIPLLDLTTGKVTALPGTEHSEGDPTDAGTIVRGTCLDWTGQTLTVRITKPASPTKPQMVKFDAAPYLSKGEQVVRVPTGSAIERNGPQCLFRRGAGDLGYLAVYETPTKKDFGWMDVKTIRAFLVVNARTGQFVRRVNLSMAFDTGTGVILDYFDGALLAYRATGDEPGFLENPADLIRLDMVTGRRNLLTRCAAGLWPMLPGLT